MILVQVEGLIDAQDRGRELEVISVGFEAGAQFQVWLDSASAEVFDLELGHEITRVPGEAGAHATHVRRNASLSRTIRVQRRAVATGIATAPNFHDHHLTRCDQVAMSVPVGAGDLAAALWLAGDEGVVLIVRVEHEAYVG